MAVGGGVVGAGVFVDFVGVVVLVLAELDGFCGEVGGGGGEVVVLEGPFAGEEAEVGRPFPDVFGDGAVFGLVELEGDFAVDEGVGVGSSAMLRVWEDRVKEKK